MNSKKKYYIRGLGFGILITAIIFTIQNNITKNKTVMSDAEICLRAEELGYVLKDDLEIVPTSGAINLDELKDKLLTLTPSPKPENTNEPAATTVPSNTPEPTDIPPATDTPAPTDTPTPAPAATSTPVPTPTPEPTKVPDENIVTVYTATIVVRGGMTCTDVCYMCEREHIIQNAEALINYVMAHKLTNDFLVGEFKLSSDMSFEEIVEKLTGKEIQ